MKSMKTMFKLGDKVRSLGGVEGEIVRLNEDRRSVADRPGPLSPPPRLAENDLVGHSAFPDDFNTGAAFDHYDDGLEHSVWLGLMRERFEILRNLISEDGAIFVQLDDKETHYCKVLLDEVFGRSNYMNTVIVATNKPFGFSRPLKKSWPRWRRARPRLALCAVPWPPFVPGCAPMCRVSNLWP